MKRARRLVLILGLVGAGAAATAASAFWISHGNGSAAATVASLGAPGGVSAPASVAGSTVHVSWNTVTSPAGGNDVEFWVRRYQGATATDACGSTQSAPLVAGTNSCNDTGVGSGTYTYKVTSTWRTWTAVSAATGAVSVQNDAAAPTASIAFPVSATTYNASGYGAGCSPVGICGSATDISGVQSVKVSILKAGGSYWNGSAFASATEVFNTATLATPGATTSSWNYPLALPAEAQYTIHVQTADTVGNVQTGTTYAATGTFTIDTAAPAAPTSLVLANGAGTGNAYVDAANATSVNVDVAVGAGSSATDTIALTVRDAGSAHSVTQTKAATSGAGTVHFTGINLSTFNDGTMTLSATAADALANTSGATTTTSTKDTVAPSTTDNTATIGNAWKNTSETVTLTRTDTGGSGAVATYYTTNGSTPTTSSSQGTSVALSTDGTFTVKYFSVDNAGNAEAVETAGTQVRVDKTAPSSATLTTLPASIRNGQSLTGTGVDATSGLGSITYLSCPGTSCTPGTTIGSSTTGPSYSVTWTGQPVDGQYQLLARVFDAAGNSTDSAKQTVRVDNTAPSTTDNTASITNAWKGTTQTVTLTPTDGGSGVAATYYTTDGSTPTTSSSQGTSVVLSSDGIYTVKYFSVDSAGNAESVKTAGTAIRIDKSAPAVSDLGVAPIANTATDGFIGQGEQYYVYANVSDAGSGVSTVRANTSSFDSGQTSVTLTAGNYTAFGTNWNYRSGSLTSDSSLSAGSKTFSVTATDAVNNSGTVSGTVTVDTTAPSASDIQGIPASGGDGKTDTGDQIVYTFSELMDPGSILAGWNGSSTSVTAAFDDNGNQGGSSSGLAISGVNLGNVDLGDSSSPHFVSSHGSRYNLTATMVMTTVSGKSVVTVTLTSNSASAGTVSATRTLRWLPSSNATDLAGNATTSVTAKAQAGGPKLNF